MGENGEKNIHQLIMEKIEKDGDRIALEWQKNYERNRALLEKRKREEADQAEVTTKKCTKKCTKCGEVKALDSFYADKRRKDGKYSSCKCCTAIIGRKYYQENKEAEAERVRKYRQENKERVAEYQRKYRRENKERRNGFRNQLFGEGVAVSNTKQCTKCGEVKELDAFYAHKQGKQGRHSSCKDCNLKYRQENRARLIEKKRKYYQENKDKSAAYGRKYYKEKKDQINLRNRKYRQENREVFRRAKNKRRAFKRSLPHAPLTTAQYERLYEFRNQVFGEVIP